MEYYYGMYMGGNRLVFVATNEPPTLNHWDIRKTY